MVRTATSEHSHRQRDGGGEPDPGAPTTPPSRTPRKPYVKPTVTDGEPLANVTLLSGGVTPETASPFVP